MFHSKFISAYTLLFSALSLAAGSLLAGPLAVTNPGFEADGDVTGPAAITGWTASATTYGVDTATATEAVRSVRLNNPGTLSQLTSETITTGYTYQLTADVGQLASFSGGKAKLELYGSSSGTIWQSLEISPPSGGWLTDQFVRFDATATHAGETLGIRLLSTGGTELRFDKVRLKRTLDSDYDGLEDADEATAGSNPNDSDSDDDGARDGAEVNMGFSPTNASSRPLRIVCMGDSITVGYTDNPNYSEPFEYGYRSGLCTRLNHAGYKFAFVGYSNQPWFGPPHYYVPPPTGPSRDGDPTRGDTVFPKIDLPALGQNGHHGYGGNGINAMDPVWGTAADVILLMIGINDIKKAGDDPSAALASKVDAILAAKSPNTQLIVAQITPYSGFWQEVLNYNIYIRDTLVPTKATQGHKISTVDLYSLFLSDPNNYGSSIKAGMHSTANHPNNTAYQQMAEAWFQGIESLSLNGADVLPPTIVSLSPMDGATNVPTGGHLVAVFNEDVQKGASGNIVIRKSSDNSIVETIPVTSGQATLSGRNLTIDPSVTLDSGTAYHVLIDAGVILDDTTPTPNAFAGIADPTRWNFTTTVPDTFPPTVSVFSPADNSTGVSLIADLTITFNENIQKGSGTIELRKTSDNSVVESFPVASASVSISGVNVAIDRAVSLEANTGYHLVIPNGAFKDLFDLPYGGTTDATTWNFTSGTFSIGPVAVTNHSFEGGLGGTGVGDVAAGWIWPGSTTWGHQLGNNAGAGNGSTKSYVIQGNANSGNNWELYQITGEVIQTGKTYTLEVDLYAGSGWTADTSGKIQLIARDGSGNINLLAETTGGFGLTAGAWALNQEVEYTATAAQAGKSLGIGLATYGSNFNMYFDNVRITASSAAGPDTTPPNLTGKSPEDNATGVATNTNITATFDEAIQLGSGTITLDNLSGGADVVINVANHGGQLSVVGSVLTINPNGTFANNTAYHMEIAAGAIEDLAGNDFPGISGSTGWNFTTIAAATGGPITVTNHSFDVQTSNVTGPAAVTGWTAVVSGTGASVTNGTYGTSTTAKTDGSRAAWLNHQGTARTLRQTTGEVITAGTTYTLTVDVGVAPASFYGSTATIRLFGSAAGYATALAETTANTPGAPGVAGWLTDRTVSFTATAGQATGQTLGIALMSTGGTQVYFDKVRLTATAPPPSNPYHTWKSTNAPSGNPADDFDRDGVSNAVEFVLGGLATTSDLGKLPTLDNTDPTYFIFTHRRKDDANNPLYTTSAAQYNTNLTGWTNAVHDGTNIIITETDNFYSANPGVDRVVVKFNRSTIAPGGRLFARLSVLQTP